MFRHLLVIGSCFVALCAASIGQAADAVASGLPELPASGSARIRLLSDAQYVAQAN